MEMLPTDWCAISTGDEGKNKKRGGGGKHLAKVPIFMQFVKLSGLMCVHCI